jgi:hypothetical protein
MRSMCKMYVSFTPTQQVHLFTSDFSLCAIFCNPCPQACSDNSFKCTRNVLYLLLSDITMEHLCTLKFLIHFWHISISFLVKFGKYYVGHPWLFSLDWQTVLFT